jgi:RNA polymerase sigma factor (sigma-70 family)
VQPDARDGFEEFFETAEPKLRHAYTALYGPDAAVDAAAEALAWAVEHWEKVCTLDHPVGYLFRVGQTRSRQLRRRTWLVPDERTGRIPDFEPGLDPALAMLAERQRVCVILVHGYGWSHAEVGALLGIRASTVATHTTRALERLRERLEVFEHD